MTGNSVWNTVGLALVTAIAAGSAPAKDFFVAPVEPLSGAALTAEAQAALAAVVSADEFASVEAAMSSGALGGGDRLILEPGHHGVLTISGQAPQGGIRIEGASGAHADGIQIGDSANITLAGVTVYPRGAPADNALVVIVGDVRNLVVEHLDMRSTEDAAGYVGWSPATWESHKVDGFLVRSGDGIVIRKNLMTGVYTGINSYATHTLIEGNIIRGHSADGMRLLGDNSTARANIVEDCVVIDGNHPDMVQMWSADESGTPGFGVIKNIVIDGNEFYEWRSQKRSGIECVSQGIAIFDGRIDGFQVTNNLVSVSSYHGITLAGASNGLVANNTVVNPQALQQGYPWIMVDWGKKGEESRNVVVANNLVGKLTLAGTGIKDVRNTAYGGAREFVAVQTQDFRPARAGVTRFADNGDPAYAPKTDLRGVSRSADKGPDIGAFELTPAER